MADGADESVGGHSGLRRGLPRRGRGAARPRGSAARRWERRPILPGGGAALRFLAAAIDARAVVEIGTGTRGVRALAAPRHAPGRRAHHRRRGARAPAAGPGGFAQAGFSGNRTRLITGRALDVLPRLTDGGYDLVFCDGATQEYADYLREALRLLRVGGIVAFGNALWQRPGRRSGPARPGHRRRPGLGKLVRADARLRPLLLPARRRPPGRHQSSDWRRSENYGCGAAVQRLTAGSTDRRTEALPLAHAARARSRLRGQPASSRRTP